MVLSLNVTRICLHILRDGLIDKYCLKGNNLFFKLKVFNKILKKEQIHHR